MEHQRIARPGFFRLSAALILAALTACSQQGPPVEKNGQKSAGSTGSRKPEVVRLTVPRGTAVHITLLSGVNGVGMSGVPDSVHANPPRPQASWRDQRRILRGRRPRPQRATASLDTRIGRAFRRSVTLVTKRWDHIT